jgi:flagellar hook protein FlgE
VDISSIALSGLQNASQQFDRAAAGIIRSTTAEPDSADLSQAAVDFLAAREQFSAAIRLTRVADQMQKSTLDIVA